MLRMFTLLTFFCIVAVLATCYNTWILDLAIIVQTANDEDKIDSFTICMRGKINTAILTLFCRISILSDPLDLWIRGKLLSDRF